MGKKKKKNNPAPNSTLSGVSKSQAFLTRFDSKTVWHIILIILLPLIIYVKVTGFNFLSIDDKVIIQDHYSILSNIKNVDEAFRRDAFLNEKGQSSPYYRPIQTVSFMLDAQVSGSNPWMYHLTNLLIHLLNCITLYFFLRQLQFRNLTSLLLTLLFSVHPLFASAVSWVPARGDLLIVLTGLLLFITFNKYYTSGKQGYILLHTILFFLSLFSKETAILFPVFLLGYYLFILKEKFSLKKLLPFFASWGLVILLYAVLRSNINYVQRAGGDQVGLAAFFKNLPAIPITLGKFFVPANLSTYPLFDSVFIVIGIIIIVVLVYIFYKAIKKNSYSKEKVWLLYMGFAWFLIFTLPGLFVRIYNANNTVEYYEHRTYLPMIGIIIMLAVFLDKLLSMPKKIMFPVILLSVIIGVFAFVASLHSDDYKDPFTFNDCAVKFNNPSAYTYRGMAYYEVKDYDEAVSDFNSAIDISRYAPAYISLGLFKSNIQHDHIGAETDFTEAIDIDSNLVDAYIDRSAEKMHLRDYQGAFNDLDKAAKLDSLNANLYFVKGTVFLNLGDFKAGLENSSKAIALKPNYPEAYNNQGFALDNLNNHDSAITEYKIALILKPGYTEAYNNLGMAYGKSGNLDKAILSFDSAIQYGRNFAFAYYNRAVAKQKKNDMESACTDWKEALQLGMTQVKDTIEHYCK
jgi:tetratricopeptide (TPR) repeat protein